MLTASDAPAINRKAYPAGVQPCVPEPFRREVLVAALGAALAGARRKKPPRTR
jgi:DNA-binding NarL/FixJ family response regulator